MYEINKNKWCQNCAINAEPIMKSAKLAVVNNVKSGAARNLVIFEIFDKQNATAIIKQRQAISYDAIKPTNAMEKRTSTSTISTNEMPKIQLKPNISSFSLSPVIASTAEARICGGVSGIASNTTTAPSKTVIAGKKPATVLLLSQASLSELLQSVELNINNNNNHANKNMVRMDEDTERNTVIESQSYHDNKHHQIIHHTDQPLITTNTNNSHNKIHTDNSNVITITNHTISHKLQTLPSILMINSSALTATGATISSAASTPTAAAALMTANAVNNHLAADKQMFAINNNAQVCFMVLW